MLVTIHCYTAPIPMTYLTRMKLPNSDKRKKNSASFMSIAKEARFHLKTNINVYKCECSQTVLNLEKYHHK